MPTLNINLTLGDAKVTSDEYNYIVSLRKVKSKGNDAGTEYWAIDSYHSTLNQVAKKLAAHAATGLDIADSSVFDKIEKLLEGEQHRINKKLEKATK